MATVYAVKTMIFRGAKHVLGDTLTLQERDARAAVAFRTATRLGAITVTKGTATTTTQPLTWTTATGSPTGYKVEYKAAASPTYLTFGTITAPTTAATVTGLTAATPYNYRVTPLGTSGILGSGRVGMTSPVVTGSTA
jgi:hypothetical protein